MSSQKNCCMLRLYRRQKSAGVRAAKGWSMYSRAAPPDNLHSAAEAESPLAVLPLEDLERQQRRERAQRAAAERATVEIDW